MKEPLKGFVVGVLASLTAVVVWDLLKNKYFKEKFKVEKEIKVVENE